MRNRDKKYQEAFGLHVKKLREERGWSQQQLAALSNIEVSQVSSIEHGKNAPNLHTIRTLAIALGKYPDELLKFDFNLRLNTDFSIQNAKEKRPETTRIVGELSETEFFDMPRAVKDVVDECRQRFGVNLESVPTSIALKKLVDLKKLKRIASPEKRTNYLYQRRKR